MSSFSQQTTATTPLNMQVTEPVTALLEVYSDKQQLQAMQNLCHCVKGEQEFSVKSQLGKPSLNCLREGAHHTEIMHCALKNEKQIVSLKSGCKVFYFL